MVSILKENKFLKHRLLIVIVTVAIITGVVTGIIILNKPDRVTAEEAYKEQSKENIQATVNTTENILVDSTAPDEDSAYTDATSGDITSVETSTGVDAMIFDKLYKGQSREEIHKVFGTPDDIIDSVTSGETDCYYDFDFFGKKGELYIGYNDNIVTHASYNYSYSNNKPTDDERSEVNEYALSIIDYYTEICGVHESTIYDYEWTFPNGYVVHMNYDPNETDFMCIYIKWGFEPPATGVLIN
ncbi:MAG: hypothetical protein UD936_07875 [Acutalibacteraceae bacterium]|nr:hypothetical protein [Acutalibacteraceae bacterium]